MEGGRSYRYLFIRLTCNNYHSWHNLEGHTVCRSDLATTATRKYSGENRFCKERGEGGRDGRDEDDENSDDERVDPSYEDNHGLSAQCIVQQAAKTSSKMAGIMIQGSTTQALAMNLHYISHHLMRAMHHYPQSDKYGSVVNTRTDHPVSVCTSIQHIFGLVISIRRNNTAYQCPRSIIKNQP